VTDLNRLIDKIIPPADYQHRNGFSNDNIIANLTSNEKELVESDLIDRIKTAPLDTLVVDTLAYMRSKSAIEPLKAKLQSEQDNLIKIIIAANIFKIQRDEKLIDISIDAFKKIERLPQNYFYNRSALISSFYYLTMFQDQKVNELIMHHFKHPDYLVSYNAKRCLGHAD
jgi:hypothetical protein